MAKSAYSANFTAHRGGEGVTISVYPGGSGLGITISKQPRVTAPSRLRQDDEG